MYYGVNFSMKMVNESEAVKAIAIAKKVLSNTTIKEDLEGQFAELADSLYINEDNQIVVDYAGVYIDSYEAILPEILKAIAAEGIKFCGKSYWDSTYDSEFFEFNVNEKRMTIESNYHSNDDEPRCEDCDEYFEQIEVNSKIVYRCVECGKEISEEEFLSACETIRIYEFEI